MLEIYDSFPQCEYPLRLFFVRKRALKAFFNAYITELCRFFVYFFSFLLWRKITVNIIPPQKNITAEKCKSTFSSFSNRNAHPVRALAEASAYALTSPGLKRKALAPTLIKRKTTRSKSPRSHNESLYFRSFTSLLFPLHRTLKFLKKQEPALSFSDLCRLLFSF